MPEAGPAPWSEEHGQFLALAVRVVEATPNAMIVVDHRGRIVFANARTEILFGYARKELFDRPIEVLLPRSLRSHHRGLRAEYGWAPEMRPMGAGRRVRGVRKDGSEVPLEVGLSPLTVAGETMILSSIRDMSDQLEAQERQNKVERALNTLRRSLAELDDGAACAVATFDHVIAGVTTSPESTPRGA